MRFKKSQHKNYFDGEKLMMAFVSHSTRDKVIVDKIRETLNDNDVQAYVAEDSPEPGRLLADKIRANILGCDLFIVILTKNGKRSKFVQQEIGIAVGANKPVIPLVENGMNTDILQGREYIPIDPNKPDKAIQSATTFICRIRKDRAELFVKHETVVENESDNINWIAIIAVIALIVSVIALGLALRKK